MKAEIESIVCNWADKERSKETPMKSISLLLTVSGNGSKATKSQRKLQIQKKLSIIYVLLL